MSKNKADGSAKAKIHFERSYKASLEDIWELWTTKSGFESWWGPEGFETKVLKLDLRSGGELHYAMTAIAPETIAFMKQAGAPLTNESHGKFAEVVPMKRLVLIQTLDFVPGVAPYDVASVVELQAAGKIVNMSLTIDAAHNDEWTQRATMGWESQLKKLDKRFSV
jgi:uncharacterized protein YndB with AHSA1/START domain